ncbi:hypothetical protein BYT27DRAFT_7324273 [Phlegmacium glaucopus]|nr:hypothetical protein BYT27DRAFT_7324273 [Phlegmacium glaucopus]
MVKVASTSKSGSSSKGMAGFAALISSTSLSAACKETNQGLHSGSSSKQLGSKSKADDVFAVGTIAFFVVGIMANSAVKRAKAGEFNPVYCLQSDVDISSIALTGMKQSGLCIMKSSGFEFQRVHKDVLVLLLSDLIHGTLLESSFIRFPFTRVVYQG